MITLHVADQSKVLPALLAHYVFNKTNGIFIVGFLAVVVVTAKFYDFLRIKRGEIQSNDIHSELVLVAECSREKRLKRGTLKESKEKQLKTGETSEEEKIRKESVDFLKILRLRGFNLQRVKEKKTVVKCVKLNDKMELTWKGRNPLKRMSGSCNYQLGSLMSVFLCSGENMDKHQNKSKFILEFQSKKVLCFSVETKEESLYFIRNFDNVRKILKKNSEFFTLQSNHFSIERASSATPTISSCVSQEQIGTMKMGYSSVLELPISMKSLSKQDCTYRKGISHFNPLYRKREIIVTTKLDSPLNTKDRDKLLNDKENKVFRL